MNSPTEHIRHIILWSKWVGAIHNEAQIDVEYWMTTDKSSCLLSTSCTSGDYYELTNYGIQITHEVNTYNMKAVMIIVETDHHQLSLQCWLCVWCVCVWMSWVGDVGGCWLTEWWRRCRQVTLIDGEQSRISIANCIWVCCVVYVCVLAVSEMSAIRHIQ